MTEWWNVQMTKGLNKPNDQKTEQLNNWKTKWPKDSENVQPKGQKTEQPKKLNNKYKIKKMKTKRPTYQPTERLEEC